MSERKVSALRLGVRIQLLPSVIMPFAQSRPIRRKYEIGRTVVMASTLHTVTFHSLSLLTSGSVLTCRSGKVPTARCPWSSFSSRPRHWA